MRVYFFGFIKSTFLPVANKLFISFSRILNSSSSYQVPGLQPPTISGGRLMPKMDYLEIMGS